MIENKYKSKISCLICNKTREIYTYKLKDGRGKYCSPQCSYKARRGVHVAPETEFQPGHPYGKRFVKGDRASPQTEFKKGERHGIQWKKGESLGGKGTNFPGYHSLHYWVRKTLGKPGLCTYCKTTEAKKYHWANISGEYKKTIEDWVRLCARCHYFFDRDPVERNTIREFLTKLI